jgi:thiol-disulfide isomerase/thioredoxin
MKHFIFAFLCTLFLVVSVQGQGIEFSEENWETILAQAKEQDKLVFLDAYTTWCGPCKWMSANVFPEEAVGDYYNKHFINAKIDMEKGEGLEIAKTYGIRAYPTLLFVNGDGDLVHKGLGSREAADFIALGEAANDPDQQYGTLKTRYEKGELQGEQVKSYAVAARDVGDKEYGEVVASYLKTQKDWNTEENLNFIFEFLPSDLESELYQYVVKNRDLFYEQLGEEPVDEKLKQAIQYSAMREKEVDLAEVGKQFKEIFDAKKANRFHAEFRMLYYSYNKKGNEQKFIESTVAYLRNYLNEVNEWSMLNSLAWSFYEEVDNPKHLKEAVRWAEKSVSLESNYFNNDTLAALYFKTGNGKAAQKHAQEAIRLAEESGQDPSETRALLEKIESMR